MPCSGAERQICTLLARGFELATFRLLTQRSNHCRIELVTAQDHSGIAYQLMTCSYYS